MLGYILINGILNNKFATGLEKRKVKEKKVKKLPGDLQNIQMTCTTGSL